MIRLLVVVVLLVGVCNVAAAAAEMNAWLGVAVLAGLSATGLSYLSKIES